jgi:serine/threonine protein kinase
VLDIFEFETFVLIAIYFLFLKPYWPFVEYSPTLHPLAQPSLDYLAPEHALTLSYSPASDMFSLGMLILALHNSGQPLNNNTGDWSCYKRNACEVHVKCLVIMCAIQTN